MTTPVRTPPVSGRAVARPGWNSAQAAGQWPPERAAAVRLARARDTVTRAAATGDPRAQALARRHIDAVEADARTCLSRPEPDGAGRDERAATARARAGLARMLDPDPATRAAGTDDLTRTWPAEHLDLLSAYAEHERWRRTDPEVADSADQGDALDRARAAVSAIPTAAAVAEADDMDPDVVLGGHHRELVADDVQTDSDEAVAESVAAGSYR